VLVTFRRGFWNVKLLERLERAGWLYSIGVRMTTTVAALVEQIAETTLGGASGILCMHDP
jgi:hypothetical protein